MVRKVLLLFTAMMLVSIACAQAAECDLQLELRYYAPKLKFTSKGIVPPKYSNFRDTLGIKNASVPEYRLSWQDWSTDYIRIRENGQALHYVPLPQGNVPVQLRSRLDLDYAAVSWHKDIEANTGGSWYWLAGLRYYRFTAGLDSRGLGAYDVRYAKQLNQLAPAIGLGARHSLDAGGRITLYTELSGLPLGGRGHLYDFDAGIDYRPLDNFKVNAGYRVLDLKINNNDGNGLYKLSGWYAGMTYSF